MGLVTPSAIRAKCESAAAGSRRNRNAIQPAVKCRSARVARKLLDLGNARLAYEVANAAANPEGRELQPVLDPPLVDIDELGGVARRRHQRVQRVLENMQVYRALVENNPKLLIEADLRRGG